MKIDLKVYLKDLDGKDAIVPIDGEKTGKMFLSQLLANQLCGPSAEIEPVKAYDWAVKLWNDGFIDVDKSDLKNLENFITKCKTLTVLGKGQLLKILDAARLNEASQKK